MIKPIEMDVLWWNEEQTELNKLGIRPGMENTETRKMTFYSIENISETIEEGVEMCCIRSGGDDYIVPQDYQTVKSLINWILT